MLQAECPEDIASQWHKLITDSIKKRVDDVVRFPSDSKIVYKCFLLTNNLQLPTSQLPAYKVNLFLIIESYKSAHPDMKEIVANAISKRLAELLSEGVSIYIYLYVYDHMCFFSMSVVALIFTYTNTYTYMHMTCYGNMGIHLKYL